MSSSYVRYHYHFIWMLITRKQPRNHRKIYKGRTRQREEEAWGSMLGVLLEALPKKRPLNEERGEAINLRTETENQSREDSLPKATGDFMFCPLIRRQVCAGKVSCLVLRRGLGKSLQSLHGIFTDGVWCELCCCGIQLVCTEGRGHG